MKRYIYLDTETGGLFPAVHALLSIGAVAPNGDSFHRFITVESQPGKSVDPEAVKVNGYTPEEWARRGALPLAVVIEDLREWLAGYPGLPIVAHHEGFDRGFLMEAERVTGVVMPHRDGWRCSQRLMLELMDLGLVPEGSARLDRLAELAGVGIDRGAKHDALVDAMVTRAGHEWLQRKLMAALSEADKLKDDVAMMNGRLQERTETMLERQKVWADRARKAEAMLRRVLPELEQAERVVHQAATVAKQKAAVAAIVTESMQWAEMADAFLDQAGRIKTLVKEIEGLSGEKSDGSDESDKSDAAEKQEGGAA